MTVPAATKAAPKTSPTAALPDLGTLTAHQLEGLECALCGRRLPAHWETTRQLGAATDKSDRRFVLWACAPKCQPAQKPAPLPHRDPRAAWPPGRPPATAAPPARR